MPRNSSTTGAVRTVPSSRSNRHSPYPSEHLLTSNEDIPHEQPSSRIRRRAGASIDPATPASHPSTPRRDHTPSTEDPFSLLRTGSGTSRTRTAEGCLDPENPASILDPWPDLVEWLSGPIREQKENESQSRQPSVISPTTLYQLPIPADKIPLEIVCSIFAVRDRDELVNQFNPVCFQSLRESVRHHMYGRAFFSQSQLNRGIRFLLRFLPSPDDNGMPRLDVTDRLSCRLLHKFETRLIPLERPRYVRRLLFGRECDVDAVVFMVSLCTEIREVAVTSTAFCRLFDPHSPVTTMVPDNMEITILQDHDNPEEQTSSLRAMSDAIHVSHTESPAVVEAAATTASAAKAKARADGKIYVDVPAPRGTPLQRVKKLAFLTTPLTSSLPLHLFDHLSHLAVPLNSFVTADNVFALCPRLVAAVFLLPWETEFAFQEQKDEILRQHVFHDRRVFAFVYLFDRNRVSRSRHPREYERWKDGVREAFDFWERAHAYTVDCAKMMLESLEFNNMNKELVPKYLSCFDGNLVKEPLSKPGQYETWMPMSLIRCVYVDPCVDDMSGIVLLIKFLPDVEKLSLSSKMFDQVFRSIPDASGIPGALDHGQGSIDLTIIDRLATKRWTSLGPTPLTRRVTHLSLPKGSLHPVIYRLFPCITHFALPFVDLDSSVVYGIRTWPHLQKIQATIPRFMFESPAGANAFITWAHELHQTFAQPLSVQISFSAAE